MRSMTLALLGALALAGCSSGNATPARSGGTTPPVPVARGRVEVEGGLVRLAASRDGVVSEVLVDEGQRVRAGQVLARLEDEHARLAVEVARCELEERRAALATLDVRVAAARREADRAGRLAGQGSIARRELDSANDDLAATGRERRTLEAAARSARARLDLAQNELARMQVRAPTDGVVLRRMARPGDGVSTLSVTPLFLFAPDRPRVVKADVDERFLRTLAPGSTALVLPEVDTSRELPARVLRVSELLGAKPPSDDPGERVDVRSAEVVLALETADLRIGQRVLIRFDAPR